MANSNACIRLCAVVELRIAHIRKRLAHFACIAAGKGNSSQLIICDNFIALISRITVMIARSARLRLVHLGACLHARRSMCSLREYALCICRERFISLSAKCSHRRKAYENKQNWQSASLERICTRIDYQSS